MKINLCKYEFQGDRYHEKQNLGFAFLLLGIIFAVRQDFIPGPGIVLGIIGLILLADLKA